MPRTKQIATQITREIAQGAVSGKRTYAQDPSPLLGDPSRPKEYSFTLHDKPNRKIWFLGWSKRSIVEDPRNLNSDKGQGYGSEDTGTGWEKAAAARRPVPRVSEASSLYYMPDLWASPTAPASLLARRFGIPTTLNDFAEFPDPRPSPLEEAGEGPNRYAPVTTGPLIIGPPGRYWAKSAGDS